MEKGRPKQGITTVRLTVHRHLGFSLSNSNFRQKLNRTRTPRNTGDAVREAGHAASCSALPRLRSDRQPWPKPARLTRSLIIKERAKVCRAWNTHRRLVQPLALNAVLSIILLQGKEGGGDTLLNIQNKIMIYGYCEFI